MIEILPSAKILATSAKKPTTLKSNSISKLKSRKLPSVFAFRIACRIVPKSISSSNKVTSHLSRKIINGTVILGESSGFSRSFVQSACGRDTRKNVSGATSTLAVFKSFSEFILNFNNCRDNYGFRSRFLLNHPFQMNAQSFRHKIFVLIFIALGFGNNFGD